jgi:hypothetical protein
MTRHLIVGRFGTRDHDQVPATVGEISHIVDLVASQKRFGYGIGDALDSLRGIGVFPSEMGFDVLVLASLVHAADTRLSRATESQDNWTREIRIALPVSDPERWTESGALLERLLNFLTGDLWTFTFRTRPVGFARVVPSRPLRLSRARFDRLSLFSGGLDSLIGAVDILEQGRTPLLVSHAGEGATSDAQNSCYSALKAHFAERPFNRLRVWLNFPTTLIASGRTEDTTRGRSFLFFALGVLAGTGLDESFTLDVPENGFIALNVPLDPLRLGSCSTRTTHPFYMARWNDLLTALGVAGRVSNPYWNRTKGEMVAECQNTPLLATLIASSLSCASPTKGRWQGRGIEHCGYCVPCLIRRAAVNMALGSGNDPTAYTVNDLTARPLSTRQSEGQQIRSYQFAIARLQARPALAKLLIHKPGSLLDEASHLEELAGVYRRGMNEVAELLVGVRTWPD